MMKAYELTSLFQNDANLFFEVKDIREGYGLICTNLKFMNHIARLEIFFNESFLPKRYYRFFAKSDY